MENFNETDELKRIENEAIKIKNDLNHLIFLKSSGKAQSDIDEIINEKRKELVRLRTLIERVKLEMGDNYDRYKTNKRK